MKELRGVITREELEAYGGAEIAMLDAGNDSTDSSKTISGGGNYTWSFTYNPVSGFTGLGWEASGINFETDYPNIEDRDAAIQEFQLEIGLDLGRSVPHKRAGCSTWQVN